jgi:hypothetical protein
MRPVGTFGLFLIAAIAGVSEASAQLVSITVAPPVLPVYEQPPIPDPGYMWTPGYWAWGGVKVSFNGGAGGTTAKATAQELAAANEQHTPPTTAQAQHQNLASTNPASGFSSRHCGQGRPQGSP